MAIQTRPMTADDTDAAADLLAARQRRLRRAVPALPAEYEDPTACAPLVTALLERDGAAGVIGHEGSTPVGFLAGYPRPEEIWGRAAWSPAEGSALADGVPGESMRDLHAAWSAHFVERGWFRQYVHVAADDRDLLDAWVRTGFGIMQAHAVRDVELAAEPPNGIAVRRATAADLDLVEDLLPLVAVALMRPPAYAITLPESWASFRAGGEEELANDEARHWIALDGDRAMAMASFYPPEPAPLAPDGAWELSFAMTRPEARGRGIMRALVAAGLAEARAAGAKQVIADWRTASLPTHRSWVALGFRPLYYRLHRHIDERVAWARAAAPD